MKLFAKLLLAALVVAMLLPFTILRKDDGTTMLSFSDFKLPDFSPPALPELPKVDSITDSVGTSGGQVTIYEWRDSEGNIQFTNEPPPQGVEFAIRQFDPNANVIQSVQLPTEEPEPAASETQQPQAPGAVEAPSPYSPESVKKLMDDAKNVEKLLNQRFQNQQTAID
jgi:hypothetical protein